MMWIKNHISNYIRTFLNKQKIIKQEFCCVWGKEKITIHVLIKIMTIKTKFSVCFSSYLRIVVGRGGISCLFRSGRTLVGRLQHIFNIVHIVGHFCFLFFIYCVFVWLSGLLLLTCDAMISIKLVCTTFPRLLLFLYFIFRFSFFFKCSLFFQSFLMYILLWDAHAYTKELSRISRNFILSLRNEYIIIFFNSFIFYSFFFLLIYFFRYIYKFRNIEL